MGLCMSRSSSSLAASSSTPSSPTKDTALVLMPSGQMREYPRQTTPSLVLADASTTSTTSPTSDWFLCDADVLGFDGPVPSLLATDPLRAGQIYFVLPAAARRNGLTREEVAKLAVKASAALSSRAASATASAPTGKRRRGAVVAPLVFAPPEEQEEEERRVEEAFKAAKAPPVRRQAPRVRSGKRLERFASDLDAIPECERDDE